MNTAPLDKRFAAFGCDVIVIDGHDFEELERAFKKFHATTGKPTAILMLNEVADARKKIEDAA